MTAYSTTQGLSTKHVECCKKILCTMLRLALNMII